MIGKEHHDAFVREHRWAVVTTLRADGSPSTSMVAYAVDGDELVMSVTEDRLKVRTIDRDARVTVCVISNAEPFNYVTVEGDASIQRGDVRAATDLVFDALRPTGYAVPDDIDAWIREQGRVIIRVRPRRVHGVIRRR